MRATWVVVVVVAVVSGERELGYGTKFGTEPGKPVPGRTLGLGAPPGPVGGGEEAVVEVLHRLELYRQLGGEEVGVPGYPSSCPPSDCAPGSHCSHGLCFCDADDQDVPLESLEVDTPANATAADLSAAAYDASYVDHEDWRGSLGNCSAPAEGNETGGLLDSSCMIPANCWPLDVNSICSPAFTCICKPGTMYNKRLGRCELHVSVDCSTISPDSPPSARLVQLAEEVLARNASSSPDREEAADSLLAFMDPAYSPRNYTKEELLEAFCRDVDVFALELASGDTTGDFITEVEETIEEVIATSTTVLGIVVAVFLLLLVLLCLAGCLCYCCHDSAKDKIKNLFAPTNYTEGFDNKGAAGASKDAEAGEKDDLEKVITGYQPVPQQPPASYPQGANSLPRPTAADKKTASLPRGASLPRNTNTASLKRGISPIPKAYPALAEAPPGYPESPQKTGLPPIGFPQSPPEYPQTPTPPGFPTDQTKQAVALYPAIPEK